MIMKSVSVDQPNQAEATKIEISTDAMMPTRTAKEYTGAHQIHKLVEGPAPDVRHVGHG
jgi:hypothetical protein